MLVQLTPPPPVPGSVEHDPPVVLQPVLPEPGSVTPALQDVPVALHPVSPEFSWS